MITLIEHARNGLSHRQPAQPNGLTVGELQGWPLYAYSVTNPLIDRPKQKVLLAAGNHSAEMGGNYAFEGFVDFLLSDDPSAMAMRDVAEFFVYPQLDPLGRDEGYSRGNSQNPLSDHNRFWDALTTGDNGGFPEITRMANVMRVDTNADVDYSFDFHGFFDSGRDFTYADSAAASRPFVRELRRIAPDVGLEVDNSVTPAGIFEFWVRTPQGLNAEYSYTPEFSPNRLPEDLRSLGESYALAMFVELGSPESSFSSAQIDRLTQELRTGSAERKFDLNKDLIIDQADHEFLVHEILRTYFGDTNLDGEFNSTDLIRVFGAGQYEDNVTGNSVWASGDWNGDFEFDTSDLVAAFGDGGFEQGPRQGFIGLGQVPEPTIGLATIASLLLARFRRRPS